MNRCKVARPCRPGNWPSRPALASRGAAAVLSIVLGTLSAPGAGPLEPPGAETLNEAGAADREAVLLFNTASRLYRQESWEEAAGVFSTFLERFPRHRDALEARFARGYCSHRLGRHAAAVEDLRAAASGTRSSPWRADAHFFLGRSLEAIALELAGDGDAVARRFREAAASFGEAARLRHRELDAAAASAGDAKRRELLDRAVEALSAEGEALYRAGDAPAAVRALAPLRASDLYSASRHWARGVYFLALAHHAVESEETTPGGRPRYEKTLGCLAPLTAARVIERDPIGPEVLFLYARILHERRELAAAIESYGRILEHGGARAAQAAYFRALALYERGTPQGGRSSPPGPKDRAMLEQAARELRDFGAAHPDHDLAPFALYHEALALLAAEDYRAAGERLEVFTAPDGPGARAGELLAQAWLSLGQALLLGPKPDASRAVEALGRAVELARAEAQTQKLGTTERLVQAVFWLGEALTARAGELDAQGRDAALVQAAAAFDEVAGKLGSALPELREEALYRRADALLRAGMHAECARACEEYRRRYPGRGTNAGRFSVASLELSGRNALEAPTGELPGEERDRAPAYYEAAAELVTDSGEKRRLRYLAGAARYYRGDHGGAARTLSEVRQELQAAGGARHPEFEELLFLLADSIAHASRQSGDPAARERLVEAAGLFEEYLRQEPPAPRNRAATARLHQALSFQWAGDRRSAAAAFRRFLEEQPGHESIAHVHLALAGVLAELQDVAGAVGAYRAAAEAAPEEETAVRALVRAAALQRSSGRPAEALALLDEADGRAMPAAASPALRELALEALYERAMSLAAAGRREDARGLVSKHLDAFDGSPYRTECRLQLGYLSLEAGAHAEALRAIEPLLSVNAEGGVAGGGRDEALYLRAWCHAAIAASLTGAGGAGEQPEEASTQAERHLREVEATYRKLVNEHPASPRALDAMLELGQHLFNRGAYPEAREWFSRLAARLEEERAETGARASDLLDRAYFGLAFVHVKEEDHAAARALFDRVAAGESSLSVRALFQAARSWMRSGGEREAVKRFVRLTDELRVEAAGLREEALLRLAECRHRMGEYGEAVTALEQLLQEYPSGELQHEARFALGFALQYMERFGDAAGVLRRVTREARGPVAARAQYHIGECFMDQGEHRDAAREFLTVAANFDLDDESRDWVRRSLLAAGLAYQSAGDSKLAVAQWKDLVDRFPESEEGKAAAQKIEEARRRE